MNYIDGNIHQRINFKGNNELRGIAFGNLARGYGKTVGALTAMGSPWNCGLYAERSILEYTPLQRDRNYSPVKYPN